MNKVVYIDHQLVSLLPLLMSHHHVTELDSPRGDQQFMELLMSSMPKLLETPVNMHSMLLALTEMYVLFEGRMME
jgi:hypothetical protein